MHRQISDSNRLTPDPSSARGEGNAQPFIVYKLGGSLLTLPDLAPRLISEFTRRPEQPLLIVGGGEAADIVRRWDEQFQIGEERAHWLALKAMSLNERLVQSILPGSRIVRTRDELTTERSASGISILCAHDFLQSEEASICNQQSDFESPPVLPHIWNVTSDSIAAWVTLRLRAGGLVLLKSCDTPDPSIHHWRNGEVDPYFSTLAPHLPRVEWANLRAAAFDPVPEAIEP